VGYRGNRNWDIGLTILKDVPETASLGRLGFWYYHDTDSYENRSVYNFGYPLSNNQCPGQICGGGMWGSSCQINSASTGQFTQSVILKEVKAESTD
jgi:hypothetical protein